MAEWITTKVSCRPASIRKTIVKALILLILSVCSSLWYQQYETSRLEKAISLYRENPTALTGVIVTDVSRYDDTDYCTLMLDTKEKVAVKVRTDKPLFPGERITLQKPTLSVIYPELKTEPSIRRNIGNNTFLAATFPYEATLIRHGVQDSWLYHSKLLRNTAKEYFSDHYPEDVAAFLTALLSSDKSMITDAQYQEFISTGTVHIVVVSGMHFGFLASGLLFALGIICKSRRKRLFITLPLLVAFAWFTGGTIPVIRSLLMIGFLFCYDIFYLKPMKSYVVVLMVACLFLAITPTLIFSPSFLLTFGATFGITAFYQPLLKMFRKIPFQYLKNHLAMYVSVQPFTLPVILLYFSRLPLGAVFANFLVAPLVAPILILSVLQLGLCKIPVVGTFLLQLTTLLTNCFLFLIHVASAISRPLKISLGELPYLLWMGSGVAFFLCKTKRKAKRILCANLGAILVISALVNTIFPIPNNELAITFMGAKNTNSAVIQTPADRLILYGTLQDIAYGRGSSYEEDASVALIIVTNLPDSENTPALLKELPDAPMICPKKSTNQAEPIGNITWVEDSMTTQIDGIRICLYADAKNLYETEFLYGEHCFSFSQDAEYILRTSHQNPDKIWILNFLQASRATQQIQKFPDDFRILSKKDWHPNTKQYDNYSMLKFRKNEIVIYGTKEKSLLWN